MRMSALQAAEQILTEAGIPLDARTITERMLSQQLWTTSGTTPEATVSAGIYTDIKNHKLSSHFHLTSRGIFALRVWGLPEYVGTSHNNISDQAQSEHTAPISAAPVSSISRTRSFTDAAQDILDRYSHQQPMHYREITRKALVKGQRLMLHDLTLCQLHL